MRQRLSFKAAAFDLRCTLLFDLLREPLRTLLHDFRAYREVLGLNADLGDEFV